MMRNSLGDRLVCIVVNSARIFVSPMDLFLVWSRIVRMIYDLVLIVMELQVTWDKDFMESMILTRYKNRGIVSENREKLRFAYRLISSMNPSTVSGILLDY